MDAKDKKQIAKIEKQIQELMKTICDLKYSASTVRIKERADDLLYGIKDDYNSKFYNLKNL